MAQIIHFFEYLEYDDIDKLDISYENPEKGDNQTYIANLTNPISFYLPKSEIIDLYQDDFGKNIASYLVNITEHVELLTFLENMDSLCINHASIHSEDWFKKTFASKVLVKYYNNLYSLDDDEDNLAEQISVDLEINDSKFIEQIEDYNNSDTLNIVAKIEGIEFFRQTFKWKIILDDIVDGIGDYDNESDNSEIDFNIAMDEGVTSKSDNISSIEDNLIENNIIENTNIGNTENKSIENAEISIQTTDNKSRENAEISIQTTDNKSRENAEISIQTTENKSVENAEVSIQTTENKSVENAEVSIQTTENKSVENAEVSIQTTENKSVENVAVNRQNIEDRSEENVENKNIENIVNEVNIEKNIEILHSPKISISDSVKINDEVINELADTENNTLSNNDMQFISKKESQESQESNSSQSLENNKIDTNTLIEIESMINDKRVEAKKYLLNAERAQRASKTLSEKAAQVSLEVRNYENKLRNLSQGSSL